MNQVTAKITISGCKALNAQQYASQFSAMPEWMDGINRITLPAGAMAGTGKFLISRESFDANFPETEPFDIVITRYIDGTPTEITLQGYVTVSAFAASRMTNSAMVVTVADIRQVIGQTVTNRRWNLPDDTATAKTWAEVLADLATDLGSYVDDLALVTTPTTTPSNLLYEGWYSLEALQDFANRTRHCLIYDPFAGSLKLDNMTGEQTGLSAIIDAAKLYRPYDMVDTELAHDVGTVAVMFDTANGTEILKKVEIGTDPNEWIAWGTTVADGTNDTDLDDEAQLLADTVMDWAARKIDSRIDGYFSAIEVMPGSEVGMVVWQIENLDLHTIIHRTAPPPPVTKRQIVKAAVRTCETSETESPTLLPPYGGNCCFRVGVVHTIIDYTAGCGILRSWVEATDQTICCGTPDPSLPSNPSDCESSEFNAIIKARECDNTFLVFPPFGVNGNGYDSFKGQYAEILSLTSSHDPISDGDVVTFTTTFKLRDDYGANTYDSNSGTGEFPVFPAPWNMGGLAIQFVASTNDAPECITKGVTYTHTWTIKFFFTGCGERYFTYYVLVGHWNINPGTSMITFESDGTASPACPADNPAPAGPIVKCAPSGSSASSSGSGSSVSSSGSLSGISSI